MPGAAASGDAPTSGEPYARTPGLGQPHDHGERLGVGTRVTANWRARGTYYPGKIVRVNADGTYAIEYDEGGQETNVRRGLIRLDEGYI